LIATEAGAVVATRTGEPFPRKIEVHEPAMLVARDGSVLSDLCDALTAADSG
jgi:hypothetical protein